MKKALSQLNKTIYVKSIHGPLFWGLSEKFFHQISTTEIHEIIIYMGDLHHIDQTGLFALQEAIQMLESKNITVYIVNLHKQPKALLLKTGFIPKAVENEHIFANYRDFFDFRLNS